MQLYTPSLDLLYPRRPSVDGRVDRHVGGRSLGFETITAYYRVGCRLLQQHHLRIPRGCDLFVYLPHHYCPSNIIIVASAQT